MTDKEQIRVLLVDDHDMLRSALKLFLEAMDDIIVIAEASNGEEAIAFCDDLSPDVVVMDIKMSVMDGITAIQHIHTKHPEIKIVVLTSFAEKDLVREALEVGASGYLLKDGGSRELYEGIYDALRGQTALSPHAADLLDAATEQSTRLGHDLSSRELEILTLVVRNLDSKQIGEKLQLDDEVVKEHLTIIYGKLGVRNHAEAKVIAIRHELVRLHDDE